MKTTEAIAAEHERNFNLEISRDELNSIAPDLLDCLRDFVTYGLCRQNNAAERRSLSETFRELSGKALKRFPNLKLNHVGAETTVLP